MLTVHGNLQAERLGKFLAESNLRLIHIFASDLQRALKTARAIQCRSNATQPGDKLEVTALRVLREQDFGYYEGKPFHTRPQDSSKSGKDHHRSEHKHDPDFKDVESKESMAARMKIFLQDHLVPLLHNGAGAEEKAIAIVSHGIVLSQLWKALLELLPKGSVSFSPDVSIGAGKFTSLEHLGGWSNTGYLELDIREKSQATTSADAPGGATTSSASVPLHSHKVVIRTVNGKVHLQGLKRTKGGVGSAKFDEGQKSIDSFFKKRKSTTGDG